MEFQIPNINALIIEIKEEMTQVIGDFVDVEDREELETEIRDRVMDKATNLIEGIVTEVCNLLLDQHAALFPQITDEGEDDSE